MGKNCIVTEISTEYEDKLLENTGADGANEILKNATIDVPLKYLGNFWGSIEMPLINCKIELKLKWTKHCVSSSAGADNVNSNSNNIISLSNTQNYMFLL